jgi:hypothetical protein
MKTAKEMFEELGFEKINENDNVIQWYFEEEDYEFCFWKDDKEIELPTRTWFTLSFKELQAINKQVEELGWNNE